jgi:hypothetical protein
MGAKMVDCMQQAGQEICPSMRWPRPALHLYRERWASK